MFHRMRRLRKSPAILDIMSETKLHTDNLIFPLFVRSGSGPKRAIKSMPGQFQITVEDLKAELNELKQLKIKAVMPFGIPAFKDDSGSEVIQSDSLMVDVIKRIKDLAPEMTVIPDLCLCDYTTHGHCGPIDAHNGRTQNDKTLSLLQKAAVYFAEAGADMLAPSGMMDGAVQAVRSALDETGFSEIAIMHHTAKYASSFFGPFREALECGLESGDRKSHQMHPGNTREALSELSSDIEEGVDIVMVKPATLYLDIIKLYSQQCSLPVAAYHVSGEYAMLHAAAQNGWMDLQKCTLEALTSIKRAGAQLIITYSAKDAARFLSE